MFMGSAWVFLGCAVRTGKHLMVPNKGPVERVDETGNMTHVHIYFSSVYCTVKPVYKAFTQGNYHKGIFNMVL